MAAGAAAASGLFSGAGSYFGSKAQGEASEAAAREQAAANRYSTDIQKQIADANRAEQSNQFAQQLGLSRDQFAQQLGLSRDQFDQAQLEFSKKFGLEQQGQQFGQSQQEARKSAYEQMLGRGQQQMGTGETALTTLASKSPQELQQMKQDILSGSAESLQQGAGQMQAELAKQGIRGGQAATQLRRGIGEMSSQAQKDINTMLGQDAMQRQAQLMAYQQAKALGGQKAGLTPATY